MVAQITIPKSMQRALNYNEQKVQQGKAELILAQNFLKLPEEMNFHDKLERFERQMELNERAETKTIHISLNFPPEEKERMTKEFLITLADEYMERIGFGEQPYLVYQHHDSGHPHCHVVSTLIRNDGTRINTHHLGKDVSDPARKEMEVKYDLISSNKKEWERVNESQLAITPRKIQAGKTDTMRSITNVLDHVVEQYKYTSIPELNAVLKLYNVKADRGAEEGRIYKNRGLTYVVIDQDGKALTKPTKASAFHNKPTLNKLEQHMEVNKGKREPDKKHTKNAIEWAFRSNPTTLGELAKLLQKERIDMVIRRSEQGQVYGVTYINHEKKAVFNGSDLEKGYAAKRLLERLRMEHTPELSKQPEKDKEMQQAKEMEQQKPAQGQQKGNSQNERQREAAQTESSNTKAFDKSRQHEKEISPVEEIGKSVGKIIEQVVGPDYGDSAINKELLTEEQRKKKKGLNKEWEM